MANLFDLAATISVNAAQSDRALTATQQKVLSLAKEFSHLDTKATQSGQKTAASLNKVHQASTKTTQATSQLKGVFQGLSNATSTLDGPLGGIAARFSSIASLGAGVSSSAGAIGIAFGALAVATVGLAAGIYKLVTSSAEATGSLYDLSQQTGFSVETLSALKNAAELSGGSIASVSSALFIFETKMGEAKDAGSEMGKMFKALSIDTTDNERAVRQAITALLSMKNAEDQATVGKKLFGRSVKDLLGAVKEAGSLDAFLNQQLKEGTLITTQAAKEGDRLSDSVTKIGQKFSASTRIVADEFAPTVMSALKQFDEFLLRNQGTIREWTDYISDAARGASVLASFIAQVGGAVTGLGNIPIPMILQLLGNVSGATGILKGMAQLGAAPKSTYLDPREAVGNEWGKRPGPGIQMPRVGSAGSGGGAKRDSAVTAAQQLLNSLLDEYARNQAKAQDLTKVEIVQQELLKDKYKGTSKALIDLRQRIFDLATSITIDAQETERLNVIKARMKENLDRGNRAAEEQVNIEKMAAEATQRLREELSQLQFGQETNVTAAGKFAARIQAMAEETGGMTEETRRLVAELLKLSATLDQVTADKAAAEKWKQLGDKIGFPDSGDYDREQRQAEEDRMRRVQDMASQITYALDNAIYEGFRGGVKRGLASLLQSFMDMIRNVLMKQLEQQLTEVLSKIQIGGGSSGGGWLSKIFGVLLGGLGGIGGGGKGGSWGKLGGQIGFPTGSFASGIDYVPHDMLAMIHKGERVVPAEQNRGGGGNVTIQVFAKDAQSFGSRETQAQIVRAYSNAMQKVVLTG